MNTNQNPLSKGINSRSLRKSVNAQCYGCVGGHIDDLRTRISVVSYIRGCESKLCPLWNVRPFTLSKRPSKKKKSPEQVQADHGITTVEVAK